MKAVAMKAVGNASSKASKTALLFPIIAQTPTSHYIIRHCLENIQHSRQQHSKNTADNTTVIPNHIKTTPQTKKTSPKTRKNPKNKTFQKLEHRKHN
jgi:NADH:ubiquinone oxidoreductase subunit D